MSGDYFSRIAGSVNIPLLQSKRVVVVGVGAVGSQIAHELARCGVGRLCLIDHDLVETENLARHVLPNEYVDWNKAQALAVYLADQIEGLQTEAVARKIDGSIPDRLLDQWLTNADLIIAATDDREAQRWIGRRALALGTPAIFPALYPRGGGEVVVQLDPRLPCFFCWDGFRMNEEQLRGVTAPNIITLPVIYTAITLSLGMLDSHSEHRRLMVAESNEPVNQLFVHDRLGGRRSVSLTRRRNCPLCAVGPASLRAQVTGVRGMTPSTVRTRSPAPQPMTNRGKLIVAALILLVIVGIIILFTLPSGPGAGYTAPPEYASPSGS